MTTATTDVADDLDEIARQLMWRARQKLSAGLNREEVQSLSDRLDHLARRLRATAKTPPTS